MHKDHLILAAVGDVHCGKSAESSLHNLFNDISQNADVLLLCGDLTDYGLPEEAHILTKELSRISRMPILAVFGNHDYESARQQELMKIFGEAGVRVLDGDTFEHQGVGFVGVKGFGGGFGKRMLEPWGESAIKIFVREAVEESLKLETGLARLHTAQKVVLLHYSPIEATVQGEPLETHAFLGSSRLEEPINRYNATVVFHGHAHLGHPEGQTREGIPVYNVSAHVLKKCYPDKPTVRYYAVPANSPKDDETPNSFMPEPIAHNG